jgi:hypothetical protein
VSRGAVYLSVNVLHRILLLLLIPRPTVQLETAGLETAERVLRRPPAHVQTIVIQIFIFLGNAQDMDSCKQI